MSKKIVIGMLAGALAGFLLGDKAANFGEIGVIVIQLIKVVAIPLLFLTVVKGIIDNPVSWADGRRLILFTFVNGTLALLIGLTLSNALKPGEYLKVPQITDAAVPPIKTFNWVETLKSYVPTSIVSPFAENAVIPMVLIALLFAFALKKAAQEDQLRGPMMNLIKLLDLMLRSVEIALTWIVNLIPIAVFFVVAKAVGQYGFAPLKGLSVYVGVALLGFAIHVLLVHQTELILLTRISLKQFWRAARQPMIYAAGANSSLATLPVTLRALKNLQVSEKSASLGACVGTNMNNDGIILYEAMAMLFVAQAYGIEMSVFDQVIASLLCLVAAMGVAGIPEAGFVSLSIVLGTLGLPVEILPLLLTVDWIIARGRSVVNVLSDMIISILLDRNGDPRNEDVNLTATG